MDYILHQCHMENETVIACWKLQVMQVIMKAVALHTWAQNHDISLPYISLFCYEFKSRSKALLPRQSAEHSPVKMACSYRSM